MITYIPDGTEEQKAIERTTHLAIAAHQDDIAECFGNKDKWFGAIVVTDGAGSPRSGLYADYTDEQMKEVRVVEQKKAAMVGEYGFLAMLSHPSKEVKDAGNTKIVEELADLIRKAKPKYLYTHNLADKHETHVATALKVIAALRRLSPEERPEKVYGCEVWRDLDWLCDDEKVYLDCGAHPNLMRCLSAVFDRDRRRQAVRLGGRGPQACECDVFREPCVRHLFRAQLRDGLDPAHGSIRRYCRLYRRLYRSLQSAGQRDHRQVYEIRNRL